MVMQAAQRAHRLKGVRGAWHCCKRTDDCTCCCHSSTGSPVVGLGPANQGAIDLEAVRRLRVVEVLVLRVIGASPRGVVNHSVVRPACFQTQRNPTESLFSGSSAQSSHALAAQPPGLTKLQLACECQLHQLTEPLHRAAAVQSTAQAHHLWKGRWGASLPKPITKERPESPSM